eukprot:TRINITY_DN3704_c0_g1_i2.p1 TRINITY_DN3704_c0_g1~~TRINITY_DN3704_c0_g1_i2.p1  ORF type:complete len:1295 (-),score=340.44 TRINITY_DN3704_c0_g1_i2:505-4389(-)
MTAMDDVDEINFLEPEVEEFEKDKNKQEAQEKADALKEYGGKVSVCTLLSLASVGELLVFLLGILGALAHGAGQPLMCLMFGELIDSLAAAPSEQEMAVMMATLTAEELAAMADAANDMFLDNVGEVALKFIWIGLAVWGAGSIQGACFPWFVDSQLAKMRPLYFDAALHRDIGWFDTHSPGSLPGEMGADLDVYGEGFGNQLGVAIMSFSCLIIGLIIGFSLSWQIAGLMCITFPLMGFGALIMAQAMMDMVQETQGQYQKAAVMADEVLFAVRTVVAFGGEARELARYKSAVEKARKGGLKNRAKTGLGMGYIWFVYFCAMALAFWFAMTLVYDGSEDLSTGKVMSCFFCVLTVGFTIGQIFPGIGGIVAAQTSMARFFYIINNDSPIQKRLKDDRETIDTIDSMELKDVHFAYPARPEVNVLSGLNLTIKKGQKVAVVGESGSGKSTIMALLERFYDPLQGTVLVNNRDLKTISVTAYRRQIGYVGQEPVLFATTVRDNILMGCKGSTDSDFKKAAEYAQLAFVNDLTQKFDTFVGSGGNQFSGGQKQRIAIARALLKKPSVLFLDEATSALDSNSEGMIQQTIDKIGKSSELGMTIVAIAHRLSTVMNSDVIFVMKNGKVAEQGSHDDLAAREGSIYQALALAQRLAAGAGPAADGNRDNDIGNAKAEMVRKMSSNYEATKAEEDHGKEDEREATIVKTYKVPTWRLLTFSKKDWWCFGPGFLGALVSGACFPVLGAFILVDAMVAMMQPDKEEMKTEVERAAAIFAIVGTTKLMATVVQFYCFGRIAEATTMGCRVTMLTAIFRQEIGFHDDPSNTPGKLVGALRVYAYRVSKLLVTIGDKADALCSIIVGCSLAFAACWEMSLAMFGTIPIFAIAQGIQMAVMMGDSKAENESTKRAAQVLADAMLNSRTVQAAGSEKDLLALYKTIVDKMASGYTKKNIIGGISYGLANAVVFWICAAGFWFMGFLIKEGRTTFDDGQRAFMGILYAAMGAGMASALTGDLAKAKVAAHDMFEIIDRQTLINGLEPSGLLPEQTSQVGRIEFQDVNFAYPFRPDVQVLKGVSFVLQAGQSAGVVGPSGSGKSTIMSMIQRFYDPQGGSVLIGSDRMKLNEINVRWWRRHVGFVGQEPILFDTTVLENVKYGLEENETVSPEHLEKCKRMANLNFVDNHKAQGWETQVGPRGSRLSGGQKQRVAICRALVRDPPLLLLDEATSALDSQSERVVQAALEQARKGRTSIAIAHRLSTIQDCDVIVVVADGKVVETGKHQELMDLQGVYHKLQLGKEDSAR